MATPADTLRQYVVSLGIAATPSSGNPWPIVSGPMPSTSTSPDKYISVTNVGAVNRGRDRLGDRAEQPTCQFMVRAKDEDDVYDKCKEITAALDKVGVDPAYGGVGWLTVITEGDTHLLRAAHVTTPPSYIGLEETSRRVLYSINVRLSWKQL